MTDLGLTGIWFDKKPEDYSEKYSFYISPIADTFVSQAIKPALENVKTKFENDKDIQFISFFRDSILINK